MNSTTIYAQSDPQAYGSPFWIWSSTIATNFIACKKDAKNEIIFVSGRSILLKTRKYVEGDPNQKLIQMAITR